VRWSPLPACNPVGGNLYFIRKPRFKDLTAKEHISEWILILIKELFRQDLQDFSGFYFNISSFLKKLEISYPPIGGK
jgi:hypothetical protein